ncbi:hypothetical protein CAC42_657 [Sphaceloma murrayae]|uniref:Mediator of RNA polymerase II transcription subunit 4 n=1 Tax=Sphaceloma murrayae TaxID=2082308 RepID=A0A2K1QJQ9_9PEZI|nr:hypothetical protein CAC42_657 [Sphaceloma murrayae]
MLSILQTRYQRVEKALDTLLESVTAYNPSLAAADELVAADDDVNDALEELAAHHANYGRILSLRATSAALDEQIKTTLRTLADTRKTLQTISLPPSNPSTTTPTSTASPSRPVRVDELLSYAKFISKTTVPPTRALAPEEPSAAPDAAPADVQPNGLAQPHVKTEPATPDPSQLNTANPSSAATPSASQPAGSAPAPSEAMRKVLPPEVRGEFIPWPSHEIIKNGGLGAVQSMVERGIDPGQMTKSREEEMEDEKREAEEKERREREDEEKRRNQASEMRGPRREREEDVFDPDEM